MAASSPTPSQSSTPQPPHPSALDFIPLLAQLIAHLDIAPPALTPDPNPSQPSLSAKDLPPMTDELKIRLRKACQQILQLPDLDMSIAEQEAELKRIDAKIFSQREVLEKLRNGE